MFCMECGGLNPDTAKFCNRCGARLSVYSAPPEEPTKPQEVSTNDDDNDILAAFQDVDEEEMSESVDASPAKEIASIPDVEDPLDAFSEPVTEPVKPVEAPVKKKFKISPKSSATTPLMSVEKSEPTAAEKLQQIMNTPDEEEPVPRPIKESVVQHIAEPVIESAPQPAKVPVDEPVVEQKPIEGPIPQPKEPIAEETTPQEAVKEPVVQTIEEPVVAPIPQPIKTPIVDPVAPKEPIIEPAPQPTKSKVVEPVVREETLQPKKVTKPARAVQNDNPLDNLSTSQMVNEEQERIRNSKISGSVASSTLDPIDDPYWDDILPEIENEIYSIPKENILKILGSVVGLFLVIVWLIYWLV